MENRKPRNPSPLYAVRVMNSDRDLAEGSLEDNFGHSEAALILGNFRKGRGKDIHTQAGEAVNEFFEVSDIMTSPSIARIVRIPNVATGDIYLPRKISNGVRAVMVEFNKEAV